VRPLTPGRVRSPDSQRDLSPLLALVLLCLSLVQFTSAAVGEEAEPGIQLAVEFLLAAQLESGFFRYQHDLLSGRDSKQDNIVRQAGAAYALGELLQDSFQPRVREALLKALKAFYRTSIEWQGGRLLTRSDAAGQAKAGATALAMLATMMGGHGISDTALGQRWLEAWLRGVLVLQMPDGDFESHPGSGRASPYSNGEVWLALAYYNRAYPLDERVVIALQRADARFLDVYGRRPEIGFFHWGVMAAAIRFEATGDARFQRFVSDQIRAFLTRLRPRVNPRSNSCYSVEGLISGAAVLDSKAADGALLRQVIDRVRREMAKNRKLQILPGQPQIQFADGRYLVAPEIPGYQGGFLNGAYRPQLRIDATQHCLSAMLKVRQANDRYRLRAQSGEN